MTQSSSSARDRRLSLTALSAIAAIALAFALPAYAAAENHASAPAGGAVAQSAGSGGGAEKPASAGERRGLNRKVLGGLPFTGLDVPALAAVAVALTSMGLALRRLTVERGPAA